MFVATKLTHPEQNGIVTHRIAVDLLVEIAKRVELRAAMITSGLIGPLLRLAAAYSMALLGERRDKANLRERVETEVIAFRPRHEDEDGKTISKRKIEAVGTEVLLDTGDLDRWCPFQLKGTDLHCQHVLLSIMRIFQQLSDEDAFRAEFVGRHNGLQWLRDMCWMVPNEDVKLMCMRVLLGLSVEPFGRSQWSRHCRCCCELQDGHNRARERHITRQAQASMHELVRKSWCTGKCMGR